MENRIIKFRAWNKRTNKMLEWDGMYGICRETNASIAVHVAIADQCYIMSEDCHIMQFTGLFDKSGVEVYEGDIVETTNNRYEIVFQNGKFVAVYMDNSGDEIDGDMWREMPKATIIGNIHQHPNLLTS